MKEETPKNSRASSARQYVSRKELLLRLCWMVPVWLLLLSGILYQFRFSWSVILFYNAVALGFLALPFLTGPAWESGPLITPRRAIALFGVIPFGATTVALLMLAVGFRWAIMYTFPTLILLANFAYFTWFDKPSKQGEAPAGHGPDSINRAPGTGRP